MLLHRAVIRCGYKGHNFTAVGVKRSLGETYIQIIDSSAGTTIRQNGVQAYDYYTLKAIDPETVYISSEGIGMGMQYFVSFETIASFTLGWYAYKPRQ
jgi:hypothetical protein